MEDQKLKKVLIFGNSSSGKSTLAKELSKTNGLAHLDLDTLAWKATAPPERESIETSNAQINEFIDSNDTWVIEGCYTDLLEFAAAFSNEIIFMNVPVEQCITNAQARLWEPQKYESKEAQDANLAMLLNWIKNYTEREDIFSETAHKRFYDEYSGKKTMLTKNQMYK